MYAGRHTLIVAARASPPGSPSPGARSSALLPRGVPIGPPGLPTRPLWTRPTPAGLNRFPEPPAPRVHPAEDPLVMEYIPGGTLKQKLGEPLPWQEAAHMLIPVSRALQYAHQENIVHRDVKPANILLTRSGEPMLSDFGIAKILESEQSLHLTGTGVGIGTPEYMAPEQGMGPEIDHRADIYALGVVLYELITGRKPYQADTPMAVMIKKVTDPLPRPKQFMPSLPESVENVLLKALAKDQPTDSEVRQQRKSHLHG